MSWVWFPEGQEGVISQLRRGTILKVDDSGTQQILKKLSGMKTEQFEDVYRPQPHGFSSNPPEGSEGVFLAMGGRSDRVLFLGGEHKDQRPRDLKPGESVLYFDPKNYVIATKDRIFVKHEKKVDAEVGDSKSSIEPNKITHKSPTVIVDSPDIRLGGEGANTPVALCGGGCATKVKAI